jgi:hypothetical protein
VALLVIWSIAAILVAVFGGTREPRRAIFLLLPRALESPDATAASEKVALAVDPASSVHNSVGAVWAVVEVPLLCRINDIEAKYYADGEDAYDMRKYLRGKPPPGKAQPHGGHRERLDRTVRWHPQQAEGAARRIWSVAGGGHISSGPTAVLLCGCFRGAGAELCRCDASADACAISKHGFLKTNNGTPGTLDHVELWILPLSPLLLRIRC